MARAKAVGIVQLGIGLGEAGPGCAAAEMRGGQLPERIAGLDDEGRWGLRAGMKMGRGDYQQGAGLHASGIGETGIAGEEFVPASAFAKMKAREFPKRIAGLNADGDGWEVAGGENERAGARRERRLR